MVDALSPAMSPTRSVIPFSLASTVTDPVVYSRVLVLRYVLGLATSDIARILGKTPGAVRQIQVRALAELRRDLADGDSGSAF